MIEKEQTNEAHEVSAECTKTKNEDSLPYVCDICATKYKTYGHFRNHQVKKHNAFNDDNNTFKCSQCPKKFENVKKTEQTFEISLNMKEYHSFCLFDILDS